MSNLGSGREVVDAAPDLPLQKGDIELVHRGSAWASISTLGGVGGWGGGNYSERSVGKTAPLAPHRRGDGGSKHAHLDHLLCGRLAGLRKLSKRVTCLLPAMAMRVAGESEARAGLGLSEAGWRWWRNGTDGTEVGGGGGGWWGRRRRPGHAAAFQGSHPRQPIVAVNRQQPPCRQRAEG